MGGAVGDFPVVIEPLSVVYCLDAEGPLHEEFWQTVERLYDHGLSRALPTTRVTLARAQSGEFGPHLANVAAPHRLAFLDTWEQIEAMLADATNAREKYLDSFGRPLRISWFVIDLIGYAANPRRRAHGQHAVWDRVSPFFVPEDSVGWHVHTLTPDRDPLGYGTSWTSVVHEHEASLCRRLLDKGHFPASFRAGGAIERNDLSHWLERFIPNDFSALPGACVAGMDWCGTPTQPYYPSWTDYRAPGQMQRRMFPCLDADSWARCVEREDIERAETVFAFANHDRLPILRDIERVVQLLNASGRPWQWGAASRPGTTTVTVKDGVIRTPEPIFGEPFVAVADRDRVYRENAIRTADGWSFSAPSGARVAVGVNTPDGRMGVTVL